MTPSEEKAWHERRWNTVTGSRVAAVMGMNPWKSREDLLDDYVKKHDDFKGSRKTEWGKIMEGAILSGIQHFTGWTVDPTHKQLVNEYTSATLDAWCYPQGEEVAKTAICPASSEVAWKKFVAEVERLPEQWYPLDVKLVGKDQWKKWLHTCPQYYWTQMQWQMHHTETGYSLLVAKVGAHDIKGHVIQRDDMWIDSAVAESKAFMEEVYERRDQENQ